MMSYIAIIGNLNHYRGVQGPFNNCEQLIYQIPPARGIIHEIRCRTKKSLGSNLSLVCFSEELMKPSPHHLQLACINLMEWGFIDYIL